MDLMGLRILFHFVYMKMHIFCAQVASRNRADFNNLMDVYLDAVFHPRAVEEEGWWVLRQEGWRYDAAGGDDEDEDGGIGNRGARRVQSGVDGDESTDRVDFEYKG